MKSFLKKSLCVVFVMATMLSLFVAPAMGAYEKEPAEPAAAMEAENSAQIMQKIPVEETLREGSCTVTLKYYVYVIDDLSSANGRIYGIDSTPQVVRCSGWITVIDASIPQDYTISSSGTSISYTINFTGLMGDNSFKSYTEYSTFSL